MVEPDVVQTALGFRGIWGCAFGLAALCSMGCSPACCEDDGHPTPLVRGPGGELLTRVRFGSGTPGLAVLDLGSPVTLADSTAPSFPLTARRQTVTVLDPKTDVGRSIRRGIRVFETPVGPVGLPENPQVLAGLLGGDLFLGQSIEIDFSGPSLTHWDRQPAPTWFLSAAGFAVLDLPRLGGGSIELRDPDVLLGKRGAYAFSATRLIARVCANPDAFDNHAPLPQTCCRSNVTALSTGIDLGLLLTTGTGPMILGQAAWNRLRTKAGNTLADPVPGRPLLLAQSPTPIAAAWTRLPRLALVDREVNDRSDPGPCQELATARRLEQVAVRQVETPTSGACPLPCDRDTDKPSLGRTSAGYLELGGNLEVAVIDDATPFLQGLRQEVRPLGSEVSGLLGTDALGSARVELDGRGATTRAIFACAPGQDAARCRAVGRCPRLTSPGPTRSCFGLPPHGLPAMCENLGSSCTP